MSDDYTKHWTGRLIFTPGVLWMAEQGGAFWLIDAIASYQQRAYPRVLAEEFQVWTLKVHTDKSATLTMTDGNSDDAIVTQEIEFTGYGELVCQLFLVATPGQPSVLMLSCEY
jgi:hypothetical protein